MHGPIGKVLGATILILVFNPRGGIPARALHTIQESPTDEIATSLAGCDKTRQNINAELPEIRARIARDEQAIRNLSAAFSVNTKQMEDWLKSSEDSKNELRKQALNALLDIAVNSAISDIKVARQTALPFNVNDVIKDWNIQGESAKKLLYKLAQLNAHDPAWAKEATNLIDSFKTGYDAATANDIGDFAGLAFGILPHLLNESVSSTYPALGQAGLTLSISRATLASVINNINQRVSRSKIDAFAQLSAIQLQHLQRLMDLLASDVTLLNAAKKDLEDATACRDNLWWQTMLQRLRLQAIESGNITLYNRLLQRHAQIFKELGLRACESGYYPGGCNSSASPASQGAQVAGNCPAFSPQTIADALQVEESSHKDVCWGYNGKTLIATSSETPDKANKPYLRATETESHRIGDGSASSGDVVNRGERAASSLSPEDSVPNQRNRLTTTQKAGKTGILVRPPSSIKSMFTHLYYNHPTFYVYRAPCESRAEIGQSYKGQNWNVLKIQTSGEIIESADVDEFASLKPGRYCFAIEDRNDESGYGFPAFDFTVTQGRTTEVTVPMGMLVLQTHSPRESTYCWRIQSSNGKVVATHLSENDVHIKAPLNRYPLPPGEYTYHCDDPASLGDLRGSFTIVSGQVTTIDLNAPGK